MELELQEAFRLLEVLQRPVALEEKGNKLSKLFPRWLIVTNTLFLLLCAPQFEVPKKALSSDRPYYRRRAMKKEGKRCRRDGESQAF